MERGFIPVVVIAIIGLVGAITAGGGYAVYKINQIEQKNAEEVADLREKLEQVSTTTSESIVDVSTSTDMATTTEDISTSIETNYKIEQSTPTDSESIIPVVTTSPVVSDVCSNIVGVQSTIPDGYKLSGLSCIKREDKCQNVEGIQDSVPPNMIISKDYGCITESDLDAIEAKIALAEKAKRDADKAKVACNDAKDELEDAEDDYAKYQKILDNSAGKAMTQEIREASILAVEAVNLMSIAKSKVNAYCNGVYSTATIVNYDDLMPAGPTYTNCRYDGYGYISCTSY